MTDANMNDDLPADIDPAIVELCRAINEFPSLRTSGSCQGFVDGHRPGESWLVIFRPCPSPPTPEGYASLEFITWLTNGGEARAAGFDVRIGLNAPPPYLNDPAECLYFAIVGNDRHPDEYAALMRDMRDNFFYPPEGCEPWAN